MLSYSKDEFDLQLNTILDHIDTGKVFIHPTDTIYGLGCDATNTDAVKRLRLIKERYERPFSIIVPNKTWIRENCEVNEKVVEWLKKLPGPYTLILKLKNKNCICEEVNKGLDTVGVRIPDHWIVKTTEMLEKPIVTTSANRTGQDFMTSIENLDPSIQSKIDFSILEGEKKARASTIIDLTIDPEEVNER